MRTSVSRREDLHPFVAKLGARIRDLRLARGMSLEQLRKKTGVVVSHLSLIERGHVVLTIGTVDRIARALGLTPMFLVLLPEESELEAVVERIGHMSADKLARMYERVSASKSLPLKKPRPRGSHGP